MLARTPAKIRDTAKTPEKKPMNVRKSIDKWEATRAGPETATPMSSYASTSRAGSEPGTREAVTPIEVPILTTPPKKIYLSRSTEAKACLQKGKSNLDASRNMKSALKDAVMEALNRLVQLVKEGENELKEPTKQKMIANKKEELIRPNREGDLFKKLEEHTKKIEENCERMEELKEELVKFKERELRSYASVAAELPRVRPQVGPTLHSVVVSAENPEDTCDQVLEKLRKAVNARQGGLEVERVRKAKDGKIIVGCKTEEDRNKIRERIKKDGKELRVENIKNKDPLVILMDVMKYNSDEDIIASIKNQNKDIIRDGHNNIQIAYKRNARNPLTHHVVIRVTPHIWGRMMEAGSLHIDLQRVRVADQSPLVQCSLCLGYGHGRRFCTETIEKCSHCGGPHKKGSCEEYLTAAPPSCCNCRKAGLSNLEHNAFDRECPVRRKWEAIARASIAYC